MNQQTTLTIVNATSALLDLLAQYGVSQEKLIAMRQAGQGTFTDADMKQLSADAQAAIDSIQTADTPNA